MDHRDTLTATQAPGWQDKRQVAPEIATYPAAHGFKQFLARLHIVRQPEDSVVKDASTFICLP